MKEMLRFSTSFKKRWRDGINYWYVSGTTVGRQKEGQGILKFTTTKSSPPSELISVQRLRLQQRPGPFDIRRQTVEGVVCITSKDAFLLYNPSTGVASPWIETSTSTREGRQVKSIALGFDTRSKKHKVVCISSYATTEKEENFVVEVLNVRKRTWTTGAHKWRKFKDDQVQGFSIKGVTLRDCPVYLDGEIHWRWQFHGTSSWEFHYLLNFDLGRETFSFTPFPVPLEEELMDSPQKLMLTLMAVEGKIAILKSTSGQSTSSLWILHVKGGNIRWPAIEWEEENVFTGTDISRFPISVGVP